jgi:hypothetical protein
MNAASPFEKLPSEVLIMIIRSLSSPVDLQFLINTSPVLFQHYRVHRSFILTPIIHQIEASYSTKDSGDHLIQITSTLPYRLLGHSYRFVVRQEVDGLLVWLPSDVSCYINWGTHLPMICELYRQREESDHLITEFAVEGWNKSLLEARIRLRRDPASKWLPELDRPLALSEGEKSRLERGFLLFDSWRLGMCSGSPHALQEYASSDVIRPGRDSFGSGLDKSWERLHDFVYLLSIFTFVFDKFRSLVHLVAQKLQDCLYKSPTMSCSEHNRTWNFLHRTKHQELRYIKSLCSHGYAVLRNLRRMKEEELQNYVLSSYFEFVKQEIGLYLSSDSAAKSYNDKLGLQLESLCGDIGSLHDPLTRGVYFWDESRMATIQSAEMGTTRWKTRTGDSFPDARL